MIDFKNKVAFVSGANRGLGSAIVKSLLREPVSKIYAAGRNIKAIPDFGDDRVVPIALDITNRKSISSGAEKARDTSFLFNNAGVLSHGSLLDSSVDDFQNDMNTNYFGTINMARAFVPFMVENGNGAITNIISLLGLASMPILGGYCASKAALFSGTQSLRAELKKKNISVHSVFPGPIDTDMTAEMDFPKASPSATADNIIKAIKAGSEDIFPDEMSLQASELWRRDPKALELYLSNFIT